MQYRRLPPIGARCAGILSVAIVALGGCATPDFPATAPASDALRTTPYPYNADLHGADLPVEIGRFDAPAARGAADDGQLFELGFLRYPGVESANGPPIVFLLGEAPSNAVSQTLIADLRQLGDVVLFNRRGYGFSSPPPPCRARLNYPFDEPLTQARLTEHTRAHAARCLDALVDEGVTAAMFSPREIPEDLRLLSRILQASSMRLVAAADMTQPAIELIRTSPDLISKAVLINPHPSTSLQKRETTAAETEDDDRAAMATLDALAARLRSQPLDVDYQSHSGRSITLRIGELDLAFLRSNLHQTAGPTRQAIIAAAESASSNDYDALTKLVLRMRQQLGEPASIGLLTAEGSVCVESTDGVSPLAYAARWPGSALGRVDETPCSEAKTASAGDVPDNSKRILVIDRHSIDENSAGSVETTIPAFLAAGTAPDY